MLEINDVFDPYQGETGHQNGDRDGEQDVADTDAPRVFLRLWAFRMCRPPKTSNGTTSNSPTTMWPSSIRK
ncbi:MAG: hypothetical protein Ct9H300mP1_24300 [Planctomycetaceae bacterium]|nr:MAG: hypothetical protein Ct9H300mP1_24300 [Planctomycetaceae bacterium]